MANNVKKRGRKQRKIQKMAMLIAATLAILMLASVIIAAIPAKAVSQNDVDRLKNQLSSITSQKKELKKQISSLSSEKTTMMAQITLLDTQIAAAEEEIGVQEELISVLNGLAAIKKVELAEGEAQRDEQYENMRSRVRFMAEHGNSSYLRIILSAESFMDFLTKYEIIKEISRYDAKILQKYVSACDQVQVQKQQLDEALAEAQAQEEQLLQNKADMEREISSRKETMEELAAKEAEVIASYNSVAKEEENLNKEIKDMVAKLAKSQSSVYVGGSFQWPLPAANNVVTCKYGMRVHPITKVYKLHTGVDLRASSGTKIYAANAGTVITSAYNGAYGNYVVINHGGGVATLYAHMTKRLVSVGEKVKQGKVIGYVGNTGYSTAPHLHFEIIKNGDYVDPIKQYPNFKVIYK